MEPKQSQIIIIRTVLEKNIEIYGSNALGLTGDIKNEENTLKSPYFTSSLKNCRNLFNRLLNLIKF